MELGKNKLTIFLFIIFFILGEMFVISTFDNNTDISEESNVIRFMYFMAANFVNVIVAILATTLIGTIIIFLAEHIKILVMLGIMALIVIIKLALYIMFLRK